MHIFLDTNIFETDPFWKNSFSKALLDQAKKDKVKLFMSKIVYEELKRHTIKRYKRAQKEYTSSIFEVNRYLLSNLIPESQINVEEAFVGFYDNLQREYNLKLIGHKDEFMTEVLNRAINRKKPFNDEKTEVKDCVIWLTYVDYIQRNRLEQCFLLTSNISDFFNKNPKSKDPTEYEIHPELLIDTNKFRGFTAIKDFFKVVLDPIIQATAQFQSWLNSNPINEEYVYNLLYEGETNTFESAITRAVDHWQIDRVFNENEWFITGYCQVNEIEWIECSQVEVDNLEDYCIVNAILEFQVSVEGHAYNPAHDDSDDKYSYLGEKDYRSKISVSFIIRDADDYESLDIDDIEFVEN